MLKRLRTTLPGGFAEDSPTESARVSITGNCAPAQTAITTRPISRFVPGWKVTVSEGGLVVAAVTAQAFPVKQPAASAQVPSPWARYRYRGSRLTTTSSSGPVVLSRQG